MPWNSQSIARFPRLTDNSDNALAVRALACRAYENNYQRMGKWDDLNPEVRNYWCEITAAILAAQMEGKVK